MPVILVGLLLVADVVATLVWQEPVSAFRAWNTQRQLGDQLDRQLADVRPTAADERVLQKMPDVNDRIAYAAQQLRKRTKDGEPLGRILLPSQGRSYVLVAGDAERDLQKGPGVYPSTVLPGSGGTTAIAGHRTTYLAPFRKVDDLRRGDPIEVRMPYATFTYAVDRHQVVDPSDVGVIRRAGKGSRLVLTACHPLYSAAQRIVVFAHLVRTKPNAQALAGLGGVGSRVERAGRTGDLPLR